MRVHRARFLHILVIAPVAAIVAGVLGPVPRALAAPGKAPVPIVITIDPAFGGQPTPAHPDIPFDPGATGTNGLLEKDVDLDVGSRLAALLRADLVNVVLTRSSDVYVSQSRREQISAAHHAVLVVSVRANTAANSTTSGSVIAYPVAASRSLAQTLSDALGSELTTLGVANRGVALDPKSWPDSLVPTAAVDMGYLSNPAEAALMTTSAFRQDVAAGVRSGLEAYMPAIVARRNAIIAWRDAHPGTASPSLKNTAANVPEGTGFQFEPVITWLLLIALAGAVLLWREQVARVLVVLIALAGKGVGAVLRLRRAAMRRRRRRQRARAPVTAERIPAQRSRGGSVYDDIPL
jgi:N-acetylmuramoyl-L-alanine amidase